MDKIVLQKSVQRARTMVRRRLFSMQADRMLTLTFRENVTDIDEAWKCFKYFVKLMRWRYKERWAYVAVPEYQKRGAVHFHLAVKGWYNVNTVRTLWLRAVGKRGGNIDITDPKRISKRSWNPQRIAGYLSKYMSKTDSAEFNRRRYSSGGDIQIPEPMHGWLATGGLTTLLLIEALGRLTHKSVSSVWESQGYFDVIFVST